MQIRSILQIVSGFKPSVDGMGDFARRLGDALWQTNSIRSHFLVYRRPQAPFDSAEILPNTISYAEAASPSACREAIAALRQQNFFDCAILHYGPYAYSSKGEPAVFVRIIEELATAIPVLVFFHETYAEGMPWKRAFWTRGQQRQSVAKLIESASAAFTSNAKYMLRLGKFNTTGRPLTKIPIFSNLGEPEGLCSLDQRTRRLIIFGQLPTRVRLYRDHRQSLEEVCRRLRIAKVVDVGSGQSEYIPKMLAGAEVRRAGYMDEHQLSALMADSIAGVVGYWPDVWEKSGVMASYEAHALVPILVELEPRLLAAPPYVPYILAEDVTNLAGTDGNLPDVQLQQIADAAHAYYTRNQSVLCAAEAIAAFVPMQKNQGTV